MCTSAFVPVETFHGPVSDIARITSEVFSGKSPKRLKKKCRIADLTASGARGQAPETTNERLCSKNFPRSWLKKMEKSRTGRSIMTGSDLSRGQWTLLGASFFQGKSKNVFFSFETT